MWRREWNASVPPRARGQAPAGPSRDRIAAQFALVTIVALVGVLLLSKGTQILMPGPLTSAHGSIETCNTCHTKSGSSKLSFLHGLVAGDPMADSKACLTCHKMADTAFNAHGATKDVLKQSTDRMLKIALDVPPPTSARAQNAAFPTHDMMAHGLPCATCHQEHQGAAFKLSRISNEQCRSCHVVKFDSFDGAHPTFDSYPFDRRTRIIFDHAGHFGKHYPEVTKKEPNKRLPTTCSTCHDSRDDKRVMSVVSFDKTCSGCHLNQIVGKERASGPKGVAFLSVPGLDLPTLKAKNADVGEWPDASEAALTPFMKVMISRTKRGRSLVSAVDGLNLQDLSKASDAQIKAVTSLAWEIKRLYHALIKDKASDVLGDLNIAGNANEAKLSPGLVADLTASLPRDVVVMAQQQWLPNLAAEMANRKDDEPKQSGALPSPSPPASATSPKDAPRAGGATAGAVTEAKPANPDTGKAARPGNELPGMMKAGIKIAQNDAQPERMPLPSGTPRSIEADRNPSAATPDSARPKPDAASPSSGGNSDAAKPKDATPAAELPPIDPANQTDELLNLTEEEQRTLKAGPGKDSSPAGEPGQTAASPASAGAKPDAADDTPAKANADGGTESRAKATPVISIESDVDPESWAEYGGWYQQDFAIFYRPTGHKDKFIFTWLYLTGPQSRKGDKTAATAVFDYLTSKDAQGSCTKCHSVDDIQSKGRLVNFSPPSAASKQGRFTKFVHEPHFGIMDDRGCLTCHTLKKEAGTAAAPSQSDAAKDATKNDTGDKDKELSPYLRNYEQGNPRSVASNFASVKKDLCQSCHTANMARQDCLLCHNYHVNGVSTPIIDTKLPAQ